MIDRVRKIYSWLNKIQRESRINKVSLFVDFVSLRKKKISRREYGNYRMYSQSKVFRDNFLSYTQAEEYWTILNPKQYACLARNKFLTYCLLNHSNIPTSELYVYYNPEQSVMTEMLAYDYDSVRFILETKKVVSCVVKPASDSAHGIGVFVCKNVIFSDNDCMLVKQDGMQLSLKTVLGKIPLLFESVISQTEQFSLFNSSSVNTVRFMTALYPNGEVKIITTFAKIGRAGSDVDNAGGGGNVDCAIDVETGRIYNVIEFGSWQDIQKISCHPDSGVQMDGIIVNDWQYIKSKVLEFQARIPYLKTIGWDVAITDNGPVIVEINNWWDTTGQLFIGRGWKNEIEDCYNAWIAYYSEKNHD